MNLNSMIRLLLSFVLLGLAWGANAANQVQSVEYSALSADRTQLRIKLADPVAAEPLSFTIDTPARLALDFADTTVGLADKTVDVRVGKVHSVTAVEAGGRTRVVVNMVAMAPYEMAVENNTVIVTIGADSTGGFLTNQRDDKVSGGASSASDYQIEGIDFRRTRDGAGRVVIDLSDAEMPASVREEGGNIVVRFPGSSISEALLQRLDVIDFSTPVQYIDTARSGDDVQILITAAGAFDHLAYQAEKEFAVEFRALTPEEKAQIEKEKFTYTGERLSLNFQDIAVRSVLQLLADFTDINMVTSDTVGGNITLRLKNVPWDQALDIILRTKGLGKRSNDNVILIAPQRELAAREQAELEAERKIETLAPLRSDFVQINYAKASDIAELLANASEDSSGSGGLLSGRGSVTVDERTNTLLVKDTAASLENVRRLVRRLDIPVRQVQIESRIVVANDDYSKDLGVRLSAAGSKFNGGTYALTGGGVPGDLDIIPQPAFFNTGGGEEENLSVSLPAVGATSAVNFVVGQLGNWLLRLELSAMQAEGNGEIISSPRVITSNQQQATIKQGFEIPYQRATSSGATSVAFKEAVLSLDVTPQITPDDRIIMELEVSQDTPDFTRAVLGVPPINTRSVETTVLIDDGETVVLGGIFERIRGNNTERVPFFGELPTIGRLFRREFNEDNNTELLIFVTPRILRETLNVGL